MSSSLPACIAITAGLDLAGKDPLCHARLRQLLQAMSPLLSALSGVSLLSLLLSSLFSERNLDFALDDDDGQGSSPRRREHEGKIEVWRQRAFQGRAGWSQCGLSISGTLTGDTLWMTAVRYPTAVPQTQKTIPFRLHCKATGKVAMQTRTNSSFILAGQL